MLMMVATGICGQLVVYCAHVQAAPDMATLTSGHTFRMVANARRSMNGFCATTNVLGVAYLWSVHGAATSSIKTAVFVQYTCETMLSYTFPRIKIAILADFAESVPHPQSKP